MYTSFTLFIDDYDEDYYDEFDDDLLKEYEKGNNADDFEDEEDDIHE